MSEDKAAKKNRRFLTAWSILNLIGWIVGLCFVFLIQLNLEYDYKFSAQKTLLTWLPWGVGIGMFQWFKLRRLGVNLIVWAFVTALGFSILVTLYFWVLNFDSFDYWEYNIPDWIIGTGLVMTIPIGGAIIGGLQSVVLRKHISRLGLWIKACSLGLLPPVIVAPIAFLAKSLLLNILYSAELYTLVDMRWFLFLGFLIVISTAGISILTGDILLKQTNINSITITAG